jgi:hypothetical protein
MNDLPETSLLFDHRHAACDLTRQPSTPLLKHALDALIRRVPDSYWQTHEDQRTRVRTVAEALDPEETFDALYNRATEFLRR